MFAGVGEGGLLSGQTCVPSSLSIIMWVLVTPELLITKKKVHCLREGAQETLGGDAWSGGYDEREGVPAKTPALLSWPIQRDFQES